MPTPFYHLSAAAEILDHPELTADIRNFLGNQRCSFLFGNTAPDVQHVSGQRREETHYFRLPIPSEHPTAVEHFLAHNPSVLDIQRMPPAKVAFLAGFLCHLQADWLWILEIFSPAFGPQCHWMDQKYRSYIHNVLRTYIDTQVLSRFDPRLGTCLESVQPERWLSFVSDEHLKAWRDFLSGQLMPGATVQTVQVFARRQGIEPKDFYDLLKSQNRLEAEVFNHMPRGELDEFRKRLISKNIQLLQGYFNGKLREEIYQ